MKTSTKKALKKQNRKLLLMKNYLRNSSVFLLILRYLLKQYLGHLRISRPSQAFSQHLLLKKLLSNYRLIYMVLLLQEIQYLFFSNPNGGILSIPVKRKSKSFKPNPLISLFAIDAKNNSTSKAVLLITVH